MTWLWAALLVAGVTLLAYCLVRLLAGGLADEPGTGVSRARKVLDERYAAGELSTQEYEQRRAVLFRGVNR